MLTYTTEQLKLIREALNNQLNEEINEIANAGAGDYCNKLLRKANSILDLIEEIDKMKEEEQ